MNNDDGTAVNPQRAQHDDGGEWARAMLQAKRARRDGFAMSVASGLLADPNYDPPTPELCASFVVRIADAIIAELDRTEPKA